MSLLLIEAAPSERNIALPDETTEEWVAIDGGGFVTQADYSNESVMKAIYALRVNPVKKQCAGTIKKPVRNGLTVYPLPIIGKLP